MNAENAAPVGLDSEVDAPLTRGADGKSERSTIAFPYNDLEDAEVIVKAIHQVGGSNCQVDQLAAQLKVVPTSGSFRLRLQAAKVFGLIIAGQGTVTLTSLGTKLCDPKQEKTARAQAFLTVPLYRRIYDKFKGATLPPTSGLEAEMVSLGVSPKQKDKARQALQRSAKTADFFWAGVDRLVMPSVGTGSAVEDPEPRGDAGKPKGKDDGGSGGDDGGRHQLIEGLIKTLPEEGSEWSMEDRHRWLQLAAGIFDFVYQHAGNGGRRVLRIDLQEAAK